MIVSVVGFSLDPPLRSLEHFLQHKGKEPALREGKGHLVVIAKMVVDDKTTYQTKRDIRDRNPRAPHNGYLRLPMPWNNVLISYTYNTSQANFFFDGFRTIVQTITPT